MAGLLLILVAINVISLINLNLNNGNSTEVAANNTDIYFILQSFVSFLISLGALFLANRSLKITQDTLGITQDTLQLTKLEQQKRGIEQRLELFYYPISYYLTIAGGKELKDGMNDNDRRVRVRAYSHRCMADTKTRKKFEELYIDITNSEVTGKAIRKDELTSCINEDIKNYNTKIQDLNKQIQALTTYKEIEVTVAKKPWWKF